LELSQVASLGARKLTYRSREPSRMDKPDGTARSLSSSGERGSRVHVAVQIGPFLGGKSVDARRDSPLYVEGVI
jgi:hypothetical protein